MSSNSPPVLINSPSTAVPPGMMTSNLPPVVKSNLAAINSNPNTVMMTSTTVINTVGESDEVKYWEKLSQMQSYQAPLNNIMKQVKRLLNSHHEPKNLENLQNMYKKLLYMHRLISCTKESHPLPRSIYVLNQVEKQLNRWLEQMKQRESKTPFPANTGTSKDSKPHASPSLSSNQHPVNSAPTSNITIPSSRLGGEGTSSTSSESDEAKYWEKLSQMQSYKPTLNVIMKQVERYLENPESSKHEYFKNIYDKLRYMHLLLSSTKENNPLPRGSLNSLNSVEKQLNLYLELKLKEEKVSSQNVHDIEEGVVMDLLRTTSFPSIAVVPESVAPCVSKLVQLL